MNEPESNSRSRGAAHVGGLIEGVLANLDLRPRFRERLALLAWPRVAGEVVSAHSRAEAVRDGVLIVATDTSAWAQELSMRRHELLASVAKQVGEGVIREIHFRAGWRARADQQPRRRPSEMSLSEQQRAGITAAAARIEDPALRARAERAFASLERIAEWRRETGWRRCGRCGQWQRVGERWCASCTHSGNRRRRK